LFGDRTGKGEPARNEPGLEAAATGRERAAVEELAATVDATAAVVVT
jgi:hypothetical protein